MTRLVPDGFLTIREAAEKLAVGLYSGEPDRSIVEQHKKSGFDIADGAAVDEAIAELWKAVDKGDLQAFLVGPGNPIPLKLPNRMSQGIPLLRSTRVGDLSFLRPGNPDYAVLVNWFGPDLRQVSVVFAVEDVSKLSRKLLQLRRRRTASATRDNVGRPSRQAEVKSIINDVIQKGRWSYPQSLKALTKTVNDRGKWPNPVSADTVTRALDSLYSQSKSRSAKFLSRMNRM
ncbi:MAG: hypothetical protein P8Y71_02925 [Pseudolabrys sp.]